MTSKLSAYSTTPGNNNSAPPNGWPEGMAPSAVNNSAREMMARLAEWYQDAEWLNLGHTINSASGDQIVLAGDVEDFYPVGRAVRADGTVGRVTAVVFSTNTTVTVSDITFAGAPTLWEVGILSTSANNAFQTAYTPTTTGDWPGTDPTTAGGGLDKLAERVFDLESLDALVYKGAIDCSANPNYPAADAGHVYKVSVSGKIGGASGSDVQAGDVLTCSVDGSASGDQATVGANWLITQTNIDGAVTGQSSSVDGEVALFSGTSGRIIKRATGTGVPILTSGVQSVITGSNDDFLQRKSGNYINRTPAEAAVDLQGAGLDADACGFRGVPQNSQSGNYTCVAADAGKEIFHPSGAGSGDTFTIPANASVAYEIGTAITFTNLDSNSLTIAITSDTLLLAGSGSTGSRQLTQYGTATAVKKTSTSWLISGTGIS